MVGRQIPLGNCHPEILEAVEAANRRFGFHYDHPLRYDLAEMLADIMPGRALPRTNYEVSGTEAAEAAVHLALTHTKRRYIITFSSSFHGMGLGTKVLSGLNGSYGTYLEGWGGGVIKAPFPYSERIPAGMSEDQYTEYCLWYLDNHIPSSIAACDNIAGILVEPGLAEGGNWIPSTRFLSGIRDICDKNDWLMISDEVLTGLGRTGRMWGIEHYDVVPDILVYGKNLSGGIAPLCGISARDEIMGDNTDFASGSTFAGTPAGCAAAIRTLQIFERDHIVAHAKRLGNIAAGIMREWETYSIVRQARGNGLLLGVSFGKPETQAWMKKTGGRRGPFAERCSRTAYGRFPIARTRFECIPRSIWPNPCFAKDCRLWKTLSGTSRNAGTQKAMRQRTQAALRAFS